MKRQTTIQAERKEKPSRNSWVWWIAGGAAVLLAWAVLKKLKASGRGGYWEIKQ